MIDILAPRVGFLRTSCLLLYKRANCLYRGLLALVSLRRALKYWRARSLSQPGWNRRHGELAITAKPLRIRRTSTMKPVRRYPDAEYA